MSDAKAARESTEDEQTSDFLPSALLCSASCSAVSDSSRPHGPYSLWNSPGQSTGVGSLSLLQGIFPTQGSNRSPTLQADSLPAEPQGKPKNTGVGSLSLLLQIFLSRNQTGVSCTAGGFVINWAIREAQRLAHCFGQEMNQGQLLGRQLCSPLYHQRCTNTYLTYVDHLYWRGTTYYFSPMRT